MKDKYFYFWDLLELCLWLVAILILLIAILNIKTIPNEVGTRNVLPVNEDKELVRPNEVRQYVGAMAEREGLNVRVVDSVVNCESRFRLDARSRTGKYLGIWQVSSIHGVSDECRLSAVCSTKWAFDKIKRDKSMRAWECFGLTS